MSDSLLNFALPPLPSDLPLPPLPEIKDQELRQQVFTHSSYYAVPRRATSLDVEGGDKLLDNEKLEHVGDGLLGAVVTVLLHDLFPNLKHGPATMLKAHLVRDATLAQLSRRYEFPSFLRAGKAATYNLISGEKTVANLFEAYIAGLYYSYLQPRTLSSTVPRTRIPTPPRTPQKTGPATTESESITSKSSPSTPPPTTHTHITHGQAMDQLEEWLIPLFTPLAHWVLQEMRKEQARLDLLVASKNDDSHLDDDAIGAMARLNEHFTVKQGGKPEYCAKRAAGDMWYVMVIAIMKDGTQRTAEATRNTKKLASTVAAWKICQELGI
ncbi:ribonuclease III domain-containing protein [Naematelia encephala]|uniref:Ribonuclease III domain-containing protein n=1 Tax=Naematelia encephala TaxID=71784 RepID=A0A1Y2B3L3_9TREE|nr:ribonuclease III domain-containing protein [Naematelia encephala]